MRFHAAAGRAVLLPALVSAALLGTAGARARAQSEDLFRYQRAVFARQQGPVCAVIDPEIFAHAAPALRDLRLHPTSGSGADRPYLLTVSQPEGSDTDIARIVNRREHGGDLHFDLQMPPRPYSDVELDLAGQDFVAVAEVSGRSSLAAGGARELGRFVLFDLSGQHLGRSLTLHLEESELPVLHVDLHSFPVDAGAKPAPPALRGASVPPSRRDQVLFDTAMRSSPQEVGTETVASFLLPAYVPVERILVQLAPGSRINFSRAVEITARPVGPGVHADEVESASGRIGQVHLREAGRTISYEQMSVPATLGANLQGPAEVRVALRNGSDSPLPVASIALQLPRRHICYFNDGTPLTLFYGDPGLGAPQYNLQSRFPALALAGKARLGVESSNPDWRPEPEAPRFHEVHPRRVWIALLAGICLLAVVLFRFTGRVRR